MGKFRVTLTDKAKADVEKHYRAGNKATIKKLEVIFKELSQHPTTGVGQPEKLKHDFIGKWSRRINQKDRMIYSINNTTVVVDVISAMGHYLDK
jgi:toxin YoeB